ncbi:MAG: hypothetical protein H0U75_08090 [Legionella sp.]|nr:hypothetical protein [Legionella sp.]
MTLIHYLWVGPPTKNDQNAIAGHDVAGIIAMARSIKAQGIGDIVLNFWCLGNYQNFYESQFTDAGLENIIVCSIEQNFTSETKRLRGADILEDFITTNAKSQLVSERVAFKDGFSIFLLATQGGFFFDTNIFPISEKQLDLNQVIDTQNPITASWSSRGGEGDNDFYLMYSPTPNNQHMQQVFANWIRDGEARAGKLHAFSVICAVFLMQTPESGLYKISTLEQLYLYKQDQKIFYYIEIEDEREKRKVHQKFYLEWEAGIPECIKNLKFGESAENPVEFYDKDQATRWDVLSDILSITSVKGHTIYLKNMPAFSPDKLNNMGINKIHYGSWTDNPNPTKGLMFWINTTNRLIDYLNYGDVNQNYSQNSFNKEFQEALKKQYGLEINKNWSLLHHAVLVNDIPLVKALIAAGARLAIKSSIRLQEQEHNVRSTVFSRRKFTAEELAAHLNRIEILQTLHTARTQLSATQFQPKATPPQLSMLSKSVSQEGKFAYQTSTGPVLFKLQTRDKCELRAPSNQIKSSIKGFFSGRREIYHGNYIPLYLSRL